MVESLLPHPPPTPLCQAKQLGVLRAVAEGRAEQPLHFCWFEAGPAAPPAARGFAAALGLDGGQVPALVALAPKKERAAVMTARFEKVGAFWLAPRMPLLPWLRQRASLCRLRPLPPPPPSHRRQDSIKDWLDGLLSGKVRTAPLQQMPAFPAAGAGGAADAGGEAGAEGEGAAVEDEFDLADIMQVGAGLRVEVGLSEAAAAGAREQQARRQVQAVPLRRPHVLPPLARRRRLRGTCPRARCATSCEAGSARGGTGCYSINQAV